MAESTAPTQSGADEEVVQLREENLRLRDQLIARDAEIGLMRGQVVELEAGAVRALHVFRLVKSFLVPGIVVRTLARARRLAKRA
jgi:tetrahydromethanopterin S-methyltransferase subunit F